MGKHRNQNPYPRLTGMHLFLSILSAARDGISLREAKRDHAAVLKKAISSGYVRVVEKRMHLTEQGDNRLIELAEIAAAERRKRNRT